MAPMEEAEKIVETLKKCPYSEDAAIIGEVTADQPGKVVMTTEIGTQGTASSARWGTITTHLLGETIWIQELQ